MTNPNCRSEEWRPVPSAPDVLASSLGRVKGVPSVYPLPRGGACERGGKPTFGTLQKGRFVWNFRGNNYKVHRLVCEAFNGPCPEGMICCHEDEDGRNNRPGNLVWATQRHNLNAPGFLAYCRSRTGDRNPNRRGRSLRAIRSSGCDQPCRADCPAGDCAGCAFPPQRARCVPATHCHQEHDCARHFKSLCSATAQPVDGSVLRHSAGAWCPIFVDARGAALVAEAA